MIRTPLASARAAFPDELAVMAALDQLDTVLARVQQAFPDVGVYVDLTELRGFRCDQIRLCPKKQALLETSAQWIPEVPSRNQKLLRKDPSHLQGILRYKTSFLLRLDACDSSVLCRVHRDAGF